MSKPLDCCFFVLFFRLNVVGGKILRVKVLYENMQTNVPTPTHWQQWLSSGIMSAFPVHVLYLLLEGLRSPQPAAALQLCLR